MKKTAWTCLSVLLALPLLLPLVLPVSAQAWGDTRPQNNAERLKKIVGAGVYADLLTYRQRLETIKTPTQWYQTLQAAYGLSDKLSPPLSVIHEKLWNDDHAPQPNWDWVEPLTPTFQVRLVAEGTTLVMALHYPAFARLAAATPEKKDDQLIALMQKSGGEFSTSWPSWFLQTWDYGGCTHLGSGLHLQIWQELHSLKRGVQLFEPELRKIRTKLLQDLNLSQSFCRSQTQALQELGQILKSKDLSPAEKSSLNKRSEVLRKGTDLEFNCQKEMGKCHFGA